MVFWGAALQFFSLEETTMGAETNVPRRRVPLEGNARIQPNSLAGIMAGGPEAIKAVRAAAGHSDKSSIGVSTRQEEQVVAQGQIAVPTTTRTSPVAGKPDKVKDFFCRGRICKGKITGAKYTIVQADVGRTKSGIKIHECIQHGSNKRVRVRESELKEWV